MHLTVSLLSAAVAVAAAHPHQHAHGLRHAHEKREAQHGQQGGNYGWDQTTVVVPGPTVVAYVLNGEPITEAEVQEGIKNGSLVWGQGGSLSVASDVDSSTSQSVASITSTYTAPSTSAAAPYTPESSSGGSSVWSEAPSSTSTSAWSPPASSAWSPPASMSSASSSGSGNSGSGGDSNYDSDNSSGVDTPFPDGELDCSEFPSKYGAVPVSWMGLGGWTGVQNPGSTSGGFANILTVTKNTCAGASCCAEGAFCSYACPAGYQKSQWPTTQGATGQSVGGIQCQGGKLRLTNPDLSKTLCMTGAEDVTVLVNNQLSSNVPICRTDYPGTEAETVPLDTQPGSTSNLTCPDASNYYTWEGGHTSAQYYVNPEGTSVEDACQWGSKDNPWGNYAPLNLGVGYSGGAAWLAIFQNAPTTTAKLDFAVEITGDNIVGKCKYSNGQYCSGDNYDSCSSTTGCTVSISSGTAIFVLSDS